MATSFAQVQEHNDKLPALKEAYMKALLPMLEKQLETEIQNKLKEATKTINRITIISDIDKDLFVLKEARRYFAERYKDWPAVGVNFALFGGVTVSLYTAKPKKKK